MAPDPQVADPWIRLVNLSEIKEKQNSCLLDLYIFYLLWKQPIFCFQDPLCWIQQSSSSFRLDKTVLTDSLAFVELSCTGFTLNDGERSRGIYYWIKVLQRCSCSVIQSTLVSASQGHLFQRLWNVLLNPLTPSSSRWTCLLCWLHRSPSPSIFSHFLSLTSETSHLFSILFLAFFNDL